MTEDEKETLKHLLEKYFWNECDRDINKIDQNEIGYPIVCLIEEKK